MNPSRLTLKIKAFKVKYGKSITFFCPFLCLQKLLPEWPIPLNLRNLLSLLIPLSIPNRPNLPSEISNNDREEPGLDTPARRKEHFKTNKPETSFQTMNASRFDQIEL